MKRLLILLALCTSVASAQWIPILASSSYWGIQVQDNFNRANGGLGANWTTTAGGLQIVSDTAQAVTVATSSHAFYIAPAGITYAANQYGQGQITAVASTCNDGVALRLSGTSPNEYFYQVDTVGGVGSSLLLISKVLNGAFTQLITFPITLAVGDTFGGSAVGSTISAYHNGAFVGNVSDSGITTGSPGISIYVTSGSLTACSIDNFTAGVVNVLGTPPTPPVAGAPFPRIGVQVILGGQTYPSSSDNLTAQYEMVIIGGNFGGWSATSGRTRTGFVNSLLTQTHSGKNSQVPLVLQYDNYSETPTSSPWNPGWYSTLGTANWFLYNTGSSGPKTPSAFNGSWVLTDYAHAAGTSGGLYPGQAIAVDDYGTYISGSVTTRGSGMVATNLSGVYFDNMTVAALTGGCGDWLRTGTCQSDTSTSAVVAVTLGKADVANYFRTLTSAYSIGCNTTAGYYTAPTGNGGVGISPANNNLIGICDYPMQQFMYCSTTFTQGCVLNFGGWADAVVWYQIMNTMPTATGTPTLTGMLTATDYTMLRYSLGLCMTVGNAFCFYATQTSTGAQDVIDSTVTSEFPNFDEFWGGTLINAGYCGAPASTSQGAIQTTSWQNGVWRRDFQNCTIVVNPAGNGTQTITLGGTFWFMHGTQVPSVNTGASTTGFSIPAGDMRVLLTSAPP